MSGLRVLTWNCRRASSRSGLWDYLLEIDPDVALLQDFGSVPDRVLNSYSHAGNMRAAGTEANRHDSGLLVRGGTTTDVELPVQVDWIDHELDILSGNITTKTVTLRSQLSLMAMSVYIPAFPIPRKRLHGIDISSIKLRQSRDLWSTEILWATLRAMRLPADQPFIVAGDLNSSETFDHGPSGPKGNREIMHRLNQLGLYECLRTFHGRLIPTFRTARGGRVEHQLDHLYVTTPLLNRLVDCQVGSPDRVFGPQPMLSDHLPIIADFDLPTETPAPHEPQPQRDTR